MTDEEIRAEFDDTSTDDLTPQCFARLEEIARDLVARLGVKGALAISANLYGVVADEFRAAHFGSENCTYVVEVSETSRAVFEAVENFVDSLILLDDHNHQSAGSRH